MSWPAPSRARWSIEMDNIIDARVFRDTVVVAHRLAAPVMVVYSEQNQQLELRRLEPSEMRIRPQETTPQFPRPQFP